MADIPAKLFTGIKSDWQQDCMHWRGKVLTGNYGHWCPEWDDLPIDETCPEWPCSCSVSDEAEKEKLMPEDMLEKMFAAADMMKAADDNLLKAIASIAASGHINIISMPIILSTEPKPVIMLPERMYDRIFELFGPEASHESSAAPEPISATTQTKNG